MGLVSGTDENLHNYNETAAKVVPLPHLDRLPLDATFYAIYFLVCFLDHLVFRQVQRGWYAHVH
jgi:hypothetical protein